MIDLTQLLNDPAVLQSLGAQGSLVDALRPLVGFGGIPAVRQAVEYFKYQWGVRANLAPWLSLLLGVCLSLVLMVVGVSGLNLAQSLVVGIFVGAGASGWHWLVKEK